MRLKTMHDRRRRKLHREAENCCRRGINKYKYKPVSFIKDFLIPIPSSRLVDFEFRHNNDLPEGPPVNGYLTRPENQSLNFKTEISDEMMAVFLRRSFGSMRSWSENNDDGTHTHTLFGVDDNSYRDLENAEVIGDLLDADELS